MLISTFMMVSPDCDILPKSTHFFQSRSHFVIAFSPVGLSFRAGRCRVDSVVLIVVLVQSFNGQLH